MREAKRKTFWDNPNEAYEAAVQCFARALLTDGAAAPFRAQLEAAMTSVEPVAKLHAIAQTILQLTLPGTPDLYQGTEFWDRSLVDPDNRRPVDYAARAAVLAEAPALSLAGSDPGYATRGVTQRLLAFRAEHLGLFQHGDYRPVPLDGGWLGFTRSQGGRRLLVVVPTRGVSGDYPVLPSELGAGWQDLLTGRPIEAGHLADWPFMVASRAG
jgi:(1->4)-alpha-D-glucan 1-alpha-D-glucosylmutase